MKIFNTKSNRNSGFTLVETLVAVSIFSTTLVAVLVLLGQGIADTNYAKRKITAEYLAQEGIEYIRNIRDTYLLSDGASGWTNFNNKLRAGTGAGCNSAAGCYFDPGSTFSLMSEISMSHCTGNNDTCPQLTYNATTGEYSYDVSGVSSGFTRKIQSDEVTGNETAISSTVYWMDGSNEYSVSFTESLFNWVK
jgi:prepilin-type N-terminal cleavage/methylation domain-containing protein